MITGNFEYKCYKGIVVLDIHKSHGRVAPVFHTRLLRGSLRNAARVKQFTDTNMQFGASEVLVTLKGEISWERACGSRLRMTLSLVSTGPLETLVSLTSPSHRAHFLIIPASPHPILTPVLPRVPCVLP